MCRFRSVIAQPHVLVSPEDNARGDCFVVQIVP